MDKFLAKIDAAFDTLVHSKVMAALNALLLYLGQVLPDKEAAKWVDGIAKWGE